MLQLWDESYHGNYLFGLVHGAVEQMSKDLKFGSHLPCDFPGPLTRCTYIAATACI